MYPFGAVLESCATSALQSSAGTHPGGGTAQPVRRRHRHTCAVGRTLVKECHQLMRNGPRSGGLHLLHIEISVSRARGSLGIYGAVRKLLELCFLALS